MQPNLSLNKTILKQMHLLLRSFPPSQFVRTENSTALINARGWCGRVAIDGQGQDPLD